MSPMMARLSTDDSGSGPEFEKRSSFTLAQQLNLGEGKLILEETKSPSFGINTQYRKTEFVVRVEANGSPPPNMPDAEEKKWCLVRSLNVPLLVSTAKDQDTVTVLPPASCDNPFGD